MDKKSDIIDFRTPREKSLVERNEGIVERYVHLRGKYPEVSQRRLMSHVGGEFGISYGSVRLVLVGRGIVKKRGYRRRS